MSKKEATHPRRAESPDGKDSLSNNNKIGGQLSKPSMPSPFSAQANNAATFKDINRQEEFDEVEDSEIGSDGEEKANPRVNQIPNS